jgi:hypothetical protein
MFAWSERQLCALRPMSKGGHTLQCLRLNAGSPEHTIILFGGSDAYGVAYNDVIAMEPLLLPTTEGDDSVQEDKASVPWRCTELQPTNSGNIAQRMGHSSVKVATSLLLGTSSGSGEKSESDWSAEAMVVFGGYQAVPDTIVHDDLHFISVHRRWSEVIGTWNAPPLLRVERVQSLSGIGPCARHSHASCTNLAATSMFVLGGSGAAGGVLRDCFEYDFLQRSWREITMPGHGIPKEMLSSVCFGERHSDRKGSHIAVFGGRDVMGQLTSDVAMLHVASDAVQVDVVPHDVSLGAALCCHTTLKVAPWVALAVGGLSTMGPPPADTLIAANKEGSARCVPIPRFLIKADEVTPAPAGVFGFGHSSCSWQPVPGGPSRHVVVSGLAPDAASGPLEVFELRILR